MIRFQNDSIFYFLHCFSLRDANPLRVFSPLPQPPYYPQGGRIGIILSEVGGVSPVWIPNREVVFNVRVARDVRAKLCASPPWFLASDPGPCPPLLSSPLLLLLAVAPPGSRLVSRRVSRPGPVGVPVGLPVFRRVSRRVPDGVPAGVPASSSSPCPRRSLLQPLLH